MWGDRAKNGKDVKPNQNDTKVADNNAASALLTPAQAVAVTPSPTAPAAVASQQHPVHVPPPTRSVSTFGPSLVLHGTLRADEDVVIFGSVKGDVHLPNNIVSIEKGGRVDGNILAKGVHISG